MNREQNVGSQDSVFPHRWHRKENDETDKASKKASSAKRRCGTSKIFVTGKRARPIAATSTSHSKHVTYCEKEQQEKQCKEQDRAGMKSIPRTGKRRGIERNVGKVRREQCLTKHESNCNDDHEDEKHRSSATVNGFSGLTKINRGLSSPSDFDLCNSNEGDVDDEDGDCEEQRFAESRRRRNLGSHKTSKKRPSSSSSFVAVSITRNNGRKQPNMLGRRSFGSAVTTDRRKQQHSSQSTKFSANVENVKSIVGIRPTHWHRDTASFRNRRSSQQLANSSALVAATKTPLKISMKTKKRTHKESTDYPIGVGSNTVLSRGNLSSDLGKNAIAETPSKKSGPSGEATKTSFSFAPSFVPTRRSPMNEDAIGDDSGDDCRIVTSAANNNLLSSTPPFKKRRRSKPANGEWVQRLAALNNSNRNDAARLQNQAYARHQRMFLDINDPRKRAKSYIDVTILGQYNGPWMNIPEDTKITVLGYAHHRIEPNTNGTDKSQQQLHGRQRQRQEDTNSNVSKGFFAWFTFTLATARRIELQRACTLRIYNAVVLPRHIPMNLSLPLASFPTGKNNDGTDRTIRCEKTVICTQLCERTSALK